MRKIILGSIGNFIFTPVVLVLYMIAALVLLLMNIFISNGKFKITAETYEDNREQKGPYGCPAGPKGESVKRKSFLDCNDPLVNQGKEK